jgi:5,10-methenyltetrahydromethanopterin hydrogenase
MYRDWPAFTLEGWQKYRDIIALELSHDDWLAVSMAVEAVDSLKTVRDIFYRAMDASIAEAPDPAVLKAKVDSYQFDDPTLQTLIPKLNDIIAGRLALAPFVSGQPKSRNGP